MITTAAVKAFRSAPKYTNYMKNMCIQSTGCVGHREHTLLRPASLGSPNLSTCWVDLFFLLLFIHLFRTCLYSAVATPKMKSPHDRISNELQENITSLFK